MLELSPKVIKVISNLIEFIGLGIVAYIVGLTLVLRCHKNSVSLTTDVMGLKALAG